MAVKTKKGKFSFGLGGGESFGEAYSGIWEWLSVPSSLRKIVKFGLLLLLLGGATFAGKEAFEASFIEDAIIAPPPQPPAFDAATEQKRLSEMAKTFSAAMAARRNSMQYVALLEAANRQPYRSSLETANDRLAAEAVSGSAPAVSAPSIPEAMPPVMRVRSIFIVGKARAAVMDIESDGDGIVVMEGQRFAGGEGKVLKILENKVVVSWSKKRITVPLDAE